MPKTIGDLTLNEVVAIKDRCVDYSNCRECKEKDKICSIICDTIEVLDSSLLDKKIEVKDNA